MGVCNCSMFCCTLLYVHFSIAIILMEKRELIALLYLSSWCLVMVERLFLAVPRGCLQFVIVVFPDHTHLLFLSGFLSLCSEGKVDISNSVLVKKFMRGVFNKRPALPKYRTAWNPDIVLNYLSSLSSNLTLLQFSQNVYMLLLLLTGQRGQSIHLLKVEDVIFHEDSLELQFSVVLKHTRP